MGQVAKVRSYVSGRTLSASKPVNASKFTAKEMQEALTTLDSMFGVNFGNDVMRTFDAAIGSPMAANGTLPWNLLNWLPGAIKRLTQVRKIDEVAGMTTAGDWSDEEVIQRSIEFTSNPQLYGDSTNIPLSNYSPDYIKSKVVRYEQGSGVGLLAAARAVKNGDNPKEYSRDAAFEGLEIYRNLIGFFGFDNGGGSSQTFGVFNNPDLPAYFTLPADSSGNVTWATKDFNGITEDVALTVSNLTLSSGGHIDDTTPMTMILPLSCNQYLAKRNSLGNLSVRMWIKETYPNLRIVLVPEADKVNGGLNAMYLFADKVPDSGTDNGSVIEQIVPAKLMALKVEVKTKITIEDYVTATAGVIVKRPYAIVRATGL